jgi:hypothetical protein
VLAHWVRGTSALGAAAGAATDAKTLVRAAERDAARLADEGMPWSDALAHLIAGGVHALRGDAPAAAAAYAAAGQGFDGADMPLWAAVARRGRGVALAGDEGSALVTAAEAELARHHVRQPARFAAMLAGR